MFKTPYARFAVTMALVLGIALSPITAAPARADAQSDRALAIILGLVATGLILDKHNDRRTTRRTPPQPVRKELPARCFKRYETRDGAKKFFGARCLEKHYRQARHLPQRCEVTIKSRNRHGERVRRDVYSPRCLRREGYAIAGRR